MKRILALPLTSLVLTCGCGGPTESKPTAAEIFHLRSECINLAEKIRKEHFFAEESSIAFSHYDPRKNRCFVELSEFAYGAHSQKLFDGQTGEVLAQTYERNDNDTKIGSVVRELREPPPTLTEEARFKAVKKFMEEAMGEDNPHVPHWWPSLPPGSK